MTWTGMARTGHAPRSATARATPSGGAWTPENLGLAWKQPLALGAVAGELARAANGLGLFPGLFFGGFFVMPAKFHLAENALALHLLFERLEGLINVVVTNENLHALFLSVSVPAQ